MRHKKIVECFTYVLISAIVFMATPDLVKAADGMGYVDLKGPNDTANITLMQTSKFHLYDYMPTNAPDDYTVQIDLSDYDASILTSHSGLKSNVVQSVTYTYILSDALGSTYFDSLVNNQFVSGAYFTLTCIANVSFVSLPNVAEDYVDRITVELDFTPRLNSAYAMESYDYINNQLLTGISEDITYLVDNMGGDYEVSTETIEAGEAVEGAVDDMGASEQKYFDQLDAAYENAGIAEFTLSSMKGEFNLVQSIANLVWNNMPETLQYLFYAVMVIGVFGILVNSGRILKKMGD